MANYVYNQVICSKETYYRYFRDENPFGGETREGYVSLSFNKLFGLETIAGYSSNYGVFIDYSFNYHVLEISDEEVIIRFLTRWYHPIKAIVKAIELDNGLVWYTVEENYIYVSKFSWNNGVSEEVLILGEDWDEFYDDQILFFEDVLKMPECDDLIWFYLDNRPHCWLPTNNSNLLEMYFERRPSRKELDDIISLGENENSVI